MKELEMNPYVIQIDKFVNSLNKLTKVFLDLEEERTSLTEERVKDMCHRVCERVCTNCGKEEDCIGRERAHTYGLVWSVFKTIEEYGTELNVEVKRKIQKECVQAPKFLKNAMEVYKEQKQTMLWNQKIVQNREGCAVQLDSFAQMVQHATRELDASIFEDKPLEKRIKHHFAKLGLKVLTTVFLVAEDGRYEIHVTVKAQKGQCVSTRDLARALSDCCGRSMILDKEERAVVGAEYCTITCLEGPMFHTLQGVSKIGKGCRKMSGDSFSMIDLPGGKRGVILSDGMGAGEVACRESTMVVELLEELLHAGFPKETALQMMNTALVNGRDEVRFSTIDMSVFDLYSGKCEFVKAGASMTFIKRGESVECIKSASLPVGVVQKLEPDSTEYELQDGDVVIMVTDGVMDALPVGEQESLMETIVKECRRVNPREIAQYILERVLKHSGEVPMDDMTVLAIGIWSLEK